VDENAAPSLLSEGSKLLVSQGPAPSCSGELSRELAAAFYHDRSYRGHLEHFLHKQLTRTKDGATDQSRIAELCDIVKSGRRVARMTETKLETLRPMLEQADIDLAAAQARTSTAESGEGVHCHVPDQGWWHVHACWLFCLSRALTLACKNSCLMHAGKDTELERVKAERDVLYAQQAASRDQILQITAEKNAEVVQLRAALDSRKASAMSQGLQSRADELEAGKSALQKELLQQKLQLKNLEFDLAHKDVARKKDVEKLQARINDAEVRLGLGIASFAVSSTWV
jgi:hypothetical protein